MSTMASRLAFLKEPEMQRQEMALAIKVVETLDDDLLERACIAAVRGAGSSFVLAQHIYAAAKPELDHRAEMRRFDRREEEVAREERAALQRPDRCSPEKAAEIMAEFYGHKS
jgi:alkylhydroperoxidase family enzyme